MLRELSFFVKNIYSAACFFTDQLSSTTTNANFISSFYFTSRIFKLLKRKMVVFATIDLFIKLLYNTLVQFTFLNINATLFAIYPVHWVLTIVYAFIMSGADDWTLRNVGTLYASDIVRKQKRANEINCVINKDFLFYCDSIWRALCTSKHSPIRTNHGMTTDRSQSTVLIIIS